MDQSEQVLGALQLTAVSSGAETNPIAKLAEAKNNPAASSRASNDDFSSWIFRQLQYMLFSLIIYSSHGVSVIQVSARSGIKVVLNFTKTNAR